MAEKLYPGVTSDQILEGNREAILGFVWTLFQASELRLPHVTPKQAKMEVLKYLADLPLYLEKDGASDFASSERHTPTNFGSAPIPRPPITSLGGTSLMATPCAT